MTPEQQEHTKYYNLLAAIINPAVKEFNTGTAAQRQQAAAFFRDEYNEWIWQSVGASVHDLVRNRLNGDPFDFEGLKKAKPYKIKACQPVKTVMFRGRSLTLPEWAAELGIEYKALYRRYRKYGSCDRVFKN